MEISKGANGDEQNKAALAEARMALVRILWFLFMLLIFAPAFMYSAVADGLSVHQAADRVSRAAINDIYFYPEFIGSAFAYPIGLLAMILPNSTSALYVTVSAFFLNAGTYLSLFLLSLIPPPYYRRRFFSAVTIIVVALLVVEVIVGLTRDPVADSYRGAVHFTSDKNYPFGKTDLKNVEVQVRIFDKSMTYDRNVEGDGMSIKFVGEGAKQLIQLGLPAHYAVGTGNQQEKFCLFRKVVRETAYAPSLFQFTFTENECKPVNFDIVNYDKAEIVFRGVNGRSIVGTLERDSQIGLIQRLVIWLRYDSSKLKWSKPNTLLGTTNI